MSRSAALEAAPTHIPDRQLHVETPALLVRMLDVACQLAIPLLVTWLLLPTVAGAITYMLKGPPPVTARLWAESPIYLDEVPPLYQAFAQTPAQIEGTTLKEVVSTNAFLDTVLASADPLYAGMTKQRQAAARQRFRAEFRLSENGPHVIELTYHAQKPDSGAAILNQLMSSASSAIEAIEHQQAAIENSAIESVLPKQREELERSLGAYQRYVAGPTSELTLAHTTYTVKPSDTLYSIAEQELGSSSRWQQLYQLNRQTIGPNPRILLPGQQLYLKPLAGDAVSPSPNPNDPTLRRLETEAGATASAYERGLALANQSQLALSTIPILKLTTIRVLDKATSGDVTIGLSTPFVKVVLGSLAGVLLLEALLVYSIARRDWRLRCVQDLPRRDGFLHLGSLRPPLARP